MGKSTVARWISAALAAALWAAAAASAAAQNAAPGPLVQHYQELRAEVGRTLQGEGQGVVATSLADHPLVPVLNEALEIYGKMAGQVRDYQCRLVKRERVDGKLQAHQIMELKVRHPGIAPDGSAVPLGVYLKYVSPAQVQGREVIYVAGQNNGDLLASRGGLGSLKRFTVLVAPESPRAMEGTHYPITEIGMLNLTERLLEQGLKHLKIDTRRECQVTIINGAKINDRQCRYIQVRFPQRRAGLAFHVAQIFVDRELGMPVRYASYTWPVTAGGQPQLLEEFTYADVRLNVGLIAEDFNPRNPNYNMFVPEDRK